MFESTYFSVVQDGTKSALEPDDSMEDIFAEFYGMFTLKIYDFF